MSHTFPISIWDIVPSSEVILDDVERVLFVGQMLLGTATPGALVEYIGNSGEEDALFGEGSHLAEMIRLARLINKQTIFSAIPLADPAGDKAISTVTFGGSPTVSGTVTFYVYSGKYHKYEYTSTATDTPLIIADKIAEAILDDSKVQITASAAAGVLTLTARHVGTIGNGYGLWIENTIPLLTIGVGSPPFSVGTGTPTLTDIFNVIGRVQYRTIVWPNTYDLSVVMDWLNGRWSGQTKPLDGQVTICKSDTITNLKTFLNTKNDQILNVGCEKYINEGLFQGPAGLEFDDNRAALFAAVRSLRVTDDASLAQFGYSAVDSIGGPKLASLPYHNTPIPQILPKNPNWDFSDNELKEINDAGGWAYVNNGANTSIILGDIYTTYKTNAQGNPDPSFEFDNYVLTMSEIRFFIHYSMQEKYKNTRLSGGVPVANQNIATKSSILAYFVHLCALLSGPNFLLIQAGPEALKFIKTNTIVTLNLAEGIAEITSRVPINTQLRKIIGILEVAFNIGQ